MIEKIIDYSGRNKFVVLTIVLFLVGVALWCLKRVPLDAIPDLSDTQVIVYSRWPAVSMHQHLGAKIVAVLDNSRPEDIQSQGQNVLLQYS